MSVEAERREREMLVAFRDLSARYRAEQARAEQAEQERDEWRTEARHWSSRPQEEAARARAAEARVATLEAALREAQQMLYEDGANAAGEVKAVIDAALGDQEA